MSAVRGRYARERKGNLWHMTAQQLHDFMVCKGIPIPTSGLKRHMIAAIRQRLPETCKDGASEISMKDRANGGGRPIPGSCLARMPIQSSSSQPYGGGDSAIEACVGTSLPQDCLTANGRHFVERTRVPINRLGRLRGSVMSFNTYAGDNQLSVWQGAQDTLTVQALGKGDIAVQLWELAMKRRPGVLGWSDTKTKILIEPPVVKDTWVCEGSNGERYGFCLMRGVWNLSLESFFETIPDRDARFAIPTISAIDTAVGRIVAMAAPSSRAGRDTQHFAWRFEDDWLVLTLMPFPYYFHASEESDTDVPLAKVPIDRFVRAAASGTGAAFFDKMITTADT